MSQHRKPRILIAGEFSAGKTELINGLLGAQVLPSNVVSTSLPPIWLTSAPTEPFRLALNGSKEPLNGFNDVPVEDTQFCVVHNDAPILQHVDLIDTPGNSDPNIPPECWERMLSYCDAVIWCTNSVQAWRQSEKAVWQAADKRLLSHATLLMSHADRLPDEESARKVIRRVSRDAGEFFEHFMMASLLDQNDIARITDLIMTLSAEVSLTGSSHPLVEALSASSENTGQALPKDANVVPLFESQPAGGKARAIWDEIIETEPQTKAEWFAALSRFIQVVDDRMTESAGPDRRKNTASS